MPTNKVTVQNVTCRCGAAVEVDRVSSGQYRAQCTDEDCDIGAWGKSVSSAIDKFCHDISEWERDKAADEYNRKIEAAEARRDDRAFHEDDEWAARHAGGRR